MGLTTFTKVMYIVSLIATDHSGGRIDQMKDPFCSLLDSTVSMFNCDVGLSSGEGICQYLVNMNVYCGLVQCGGDWGNLTWVQEMM